MGNNTLPDQIPPQSTPWSYANGDGDQVVEIHWYLFLYGLWIQVSSLIAGGAVVSPAVNVPMVDLDVNAADLPQLARQTLNAMLLQPEAEVTPSLRDVANALMLGVDGLLPDPVPRAQPAAAVTVTASPFTYTALSSGALAISGGTVSAVAVIRQGANVPTGVVAGVIPVSRLDQVQITYTVAPTVNFLPT